VLKRTKQLRLKAMGLALALALAAAGPAVAEPAAWTGGWLTSGVDQLGRWWTAVWGAVPGSVRAASEVSTNLDPDGVAQQPEAPDGSSLESGEEPGGESEVWPNLDPNG
jgi:ABC-type sugar transport system substrate-binding protein